MGRSDSTSGLVVGCVLCWIAVSLLLTGSMVMSRSSDHKRWKFLKRARDELAVAAEAWNTEQIQHAKDNNIACHGCVPIVLYVHKRPQYFERLLTSLSMANGIRDTVVVISHDGWSHEMMQLSRSFTATASIRVVCPLTAAFTGATSKLRLKSHWHWLLSQLFAKGGPFRSSLGWDYDSAVFLEEDLVLSADFFPAALSLRTLWNSLSLSQANATLDGLWGLAIYNPKAMDPQSTDVSRLAQACVHTGFPSAGYMMTQSIADAVFSKNDMFWACRDGWDISLRLLQRYEQFPMKYLVPAVSRAKNIGVEGLHVAKETYHSLGLGVVRLPADLFKPAELNAPAHTRRWSLAADCQQSLTVPNAVLSTRVSQLPCEPIAS